MSRPSSSYIDKGVKLSFCARENAPWVILINGLLTNYDSWNSIVPMLIDDFNVVQYNGPGQGELTFSGESIELDDHVKHLESLLNKIPQIRESDHFYLGLSNGARVALKASEKYPHPRLRGIIACDCYDNVSRGLAYKLNSWLLATEKGGSSLRFEVATPWIWSESFIDSNPETIDYFRSMASRANEKNVLALIRGAMSGSIDLSAIKAPVLLMVGEEDLLTPLKTHLKMDQSLAHSQLEIIPGGHGSLLEYPETVERKVLPWIQSLLGSPFTQREESLGGCDL